MATYEPEEQYGGAGNGTNFRTVRNIVGLMLILTGAFMALWICMNVYEMFTSPQKIEIFKQIVPADPGMRELDVDGKKILLPQGIFVFLAYGIGILLLMVGAAIANGLLTGGVNLLQSSFRRFETKMAGKFEGLKSKVDEMKETLKKNIP